MYTLRRNTLATYEDKVCWMGLGNVLKCNGTNYATLSELPIRLALNESDVCWMSRYGDITCLNRGPLVRGAQDMTMGTGFIGWLSQSVASFTATLPISLTFTGAGTVLSNNQWGVCIGTSGPFSCTSVTFPAGVTQLVGGYSTYLALAGTTVYADGLPICPPEPCASSTNDLGILPIPTLTETTRIAIGYQQACAIDNGAVTCWGASAVIPPPSGVDVAILNDGVCVQGGGVLSCTNMLPVPSVGAPGDHVFCDGNDLVVSVCVSCPLGYDVTSGTCEKCPDGFHRNVGMSQCEACPPYTLPNSVTCELCPQSFLMPSCTTQCDPGSQSSPDRSTCVACPTKTARGTQASCSSCETLSLPSDDASQCLACALPYALLFTTETLFSQATCTRAPDGYTPYGTSWTTCPSSTYRVGSMSSCVMCADGYTDFQRVTCVPCASTMVRTGKNPQCFACPSGTLPDALQTQCVPVNSRGVSFIRLAGISVGGFILVAAFLFYSTPLRVPAIIAALCILVLAAIPT